MRNLSKLVALAVLSVAPVVNADVAFVLDGHKYSSPSNIIYRTDNQKIKNPMVTNCTAGGIPVPDIQVGTTFKNGDNVHIPLNAVYYNLAQGRLYLTSVFGNVECQNGTYEDGLFIGGFEVGS
ncbi:hypothetical protein [Marinicella gelatinilytica]|uniref:hypothetical protein n=1 Tax=Marinicella gelatinilytica TaxID=2996017 RepID=UPI002260F64B|nr:hypothetical protein [Marinicella gelatinilytica]MCX7545277.1 hypothetical protein [Marinicella gelatinilytica]